MVAQDDTPLLNPEEVSLRWLRQLVHDYGNVLQLSEPLPVIADSAEDAIDALWAQLVFEPATKELRYLRKTSAKAVFRYALTHRGIPATNVAESVRIRGRDHSSTMDFVIHNGMASDLTHCWSFQLPGKRALLEEIKAWAWTIHDIREHGGMTVGAGEDDLSIPSEVPIHVVYVPPTETNDATLDEALSAFQELRVTATSMRDFDSIVANIEPPVT